MSYSGDGNFLASSTSTSAITINKSIIVLDPTAGGALSISGNASIKVTGGVYVDSKSASALSASGNAQITALVIDVTGGVAKSGNATFNPAPTTKAAPLPDPLASLPAPGTTGLTNFGSFSLGGNSRATINPGIYSQISVSGSAILTLSAGLYIIKGGGLQVSGNAGVTGTGLTFYNAGSTFPSGGGSFGAISVSGNGTMTLSASTSGVYAGLLFVQPAANKQTLTFSGNAMAGSKRHRLRCRRPNPACRERKCTAQTGNGRRYAVAQRQLCRQKRRTGQLPMQAIAATDLKLGPAFNSPAAQSSLMPLAPTQLAFTVDSLASIGLANSSGPSVSPQAALAI